MTCDSPDPSALAPLLAEWLPQQRWFGGRVTATVTAVRVAGRLTDEPSVSELVLVETPAGTYQVPLLYRHEWDDMLAHVHVGTLDHDGRPSSRCTTHCTTRPSPAPGSGAWPKPPGRRDPVHVRWSRRRTCRWTRPSLVVSAEQSNTSLIFGHAAILKVFRRVEPGRNPDIEVHAALAATGGRHIARMLGHVEATWTGPDGAVTADVAMLQDFLQSATDGWQLAQISVRDLMAEGDLHADEVGGDFAAEAHRLGVATAETHADLAEALPTGSYDQGRLAGARRRRCARGSTRPPSRSTRSSRTSTGSRHDLRAGGQAARPGSHPARARRLPPRPGACGPRSAGCCSTSRASRSSRSRSGSGWTRRCATSPGCFARSTTPAATCSLIIPRAAQIAYRAEEWATRNRSAFLDGYAEGAGADARDGLRAPRAARRVRGGQGGLRGALRGGPPPVVAPDPARRRGPALVDLTAAIARIVAPPPGGSGMTHASCARITTRTALAADRWERPHACSPRRRVTSRCRPARPDGPGHHGVRVSAAGLGQVRRRLDVPRWLRPVDDVQKARSSASSYPSSMHRQGAGIEMGLGYEPVEGAREYIGERRRRVRRRPAVVRDRVHGQRRLPTAAPRWRRAT